ncbi:MAG TPA: STAS domain-containing protein [Acidimicrobiales bacterium]|jgi:anti-sigma B factor antagonist
MPKSFDIEVTADDGNTVAHLAGDLDLSVRAEVVTRVTAIIEGTRAPTRLVLDLREVTFCDSSGLGALLDIRRAAADAAIAMVLRDVPPAVSRLLDLTDVDGWLSRE